MSNMKEEVQKDFLKYKVFVRLNENEISKNKTPEELYEEGRLFWERGYALAQEYYQKAVTYYQEAANKGSKDAQYALANCYIKGEGVEKNEEEAMKWYQKASDQGHIIASFMLQRENFLDKKQTTPMTSLLDDSNIVYETSKKQFLEFVKKEKIHLKVGSFWEMGRYGGERIWWRVLDICDGKALLLSERGLDAKPYHKKPEAITWEKCDLRKWLNDEFYNQTFTEVEKKKIEKTKIRNEYNLDYHTPGGTDTEDDVFLLSIKEAESYFKSDKDRACSTTEYARKNGAYKSQNGFCSWWLRSPGRDSHLAARVTNKGIVSEYGNYVNSRVTAVRPALWINLGL